MEAKYEGKFQVELFWISIVFLQWHIKCFPFWRSCKDCQSLSCENKSFSMCHIPDKTSAINTIALLAIIGKTSVNVVSLVNRF